MTPTFESDLTVNFTKNILFNNDIEEEYTLKRITESVIYIQLKEKKKRLFEILNMRND